VNGILIINKPGGVSSSKVVTNIRKLFSGLKAGHTGTLDPLATGVLPICLGRATRLAEYIVELPKKYRAEAVLGKVSDTGDAEGKIVEKSAVPELKYSQVEEVLRGYTGDIEQFPPLYSAVKYEGKPLYHWTRKGREVQLKPRKVTIYDIEIIELTNQREPQLIFDVTCSKGTYIRTLAADIGQSIGCGAYLSALVRNSVGPYQIADALTPEQVVNMVDKGRTRDIILPMDTAVMHLQQVNLDDKQVEALKNGLIIEPDDQELIMGLEDELPIRVYDQRGIFKALVSKVAISGRVGLKTIKYLAG